jgi:hypothetical protein
MPRAGTQRAIDAADAAKTVERQRAGLLQPPPLGFADERSTLSTLPKLPRWRVHSCRLFWQPCRISVAPLEGRRIAATACLWRSPPPGAFEIPAAH